MTKAPGMAARTTTSPRTQLSCISRAATATSEISVLAHRDQIADDLRGPVRRLLLGAMQDVVVARVLVVLQVDGDRLLVDEVGDVVGDHLPLSFADQLRRRTRHDGDQSHHGGHGDEPEGLRQGGRLVGRRDTGGDLVDDELHEIELGQGKKTQEDGESDVGDRPPGRDAPHQTHRAPEMQDALDVELGVVFSQRVLPFAPAAGRPCRRRPANLPISRTGRQR